MRKQYAEKENYQTAKTQQNKVGMGEEGKFDMTVFEVWEGGKCLWLI